MRIVSCSSGITRAITLSTRLNPDEGVLERIAGVGSRAHAKASADDITPVSPRELRGRLHAVARRIGDEMRREARGCQERREGVDVLLLVAVGVSRGVGGAGGGAPGIVVRDVGREAADGGGRAGCLVDLGEERGGGRDVSGPAEPAGVAGVDVHGDVGEVELRDGVLDAFHVGGLGVGAFGDAEVCYEVCEGVGFCEGVSVSFVAW